MGSVGDVRHSVHVGLARVSITRDSRRQIGAERFSLTHSGSRSGAYIGRARLDQRLGGARLPRAVPRVGHHDHTGVRQAFAHLEGRGGGADDVPPAVHDRGRDMPNALQMVEQPAVLLEEAAVPHIVQVNALLAAAPLERAGRVRVERRDAVLPLTPHARTSSAGSASTSPPARHSTTPWSLPATW